MKSTNIILILCDDLGYGGAGNDIYYVDNGSDQVTEAALGGSDNVYASVSYALATGSEIELLTTADQNGTDAIALTLCVFPLLLFLASMTMVLLSQHFGLLWVAVEATTLASAPLIYFHRHHRSLEATWKYLVICSVGVARR